MDLQLSYEISQGLLQSFLFHIMKTNPEQLDFFMKQNNVVVIVMPSKPYKLKTITNRLPK